MKNILKFSFAALVSLSLTTSCIEEVEPTTIATAGQIAESSSASSAMIEAVAGYFNAYDGWSSSYHFAWGYSSVCLIRELLVNDVATTSSGYDVWYEGWLQNQLIGPDNLYPQWLWKYMCALLYTTNAAVGSLDSDNVSEAVAPMLGVSLAYRALIWLDMGQMYEFKPNLYTSAPDLEGLTIPYLRENMTEEESRNNPRVSKEVLIGYIKTDLDRAAEYLKGYNRSSITYINEAVVYGLKARMYMWEGDYAKACEAAQKAIDLSGCTPLTEAQWTDVSTGFNSADSQNSWMLASRLTSESDLVKTGILNWTSWMSSETTYGYATAGGCYRMADLKFYNQIPNTDWRKKSWKAPAGSSINVPLVADTEAGYTSEAMPDLANVKFRPGSGNPDDYMVGSVADFPLMRVEEMYFIIAECDAREGDASTLVNFIQSYRNPSYVCNATGDALLKEVMFQKRIEFWGEGILFFDYKRNELPIERYYEGTNHRLDSQFNVPKGLAPWFNICVVRTEGEQNPAFVSNPDPSGKVPLQSNEVPGEE